MSIFPADLYNFLAGPALVFAVFVFVLGCAYRIYEFVHLTYKIRREKFIITETINNNRAILYKGKSPLGRLIAILKSKIRTSVFKSHPVMGVVSLIFHILLFVTLIFLPAHNILADQLTGINFFTFSEPLMDKFTVLVIAIGVFFLFRRILVRRVRMLTTVRDYCILFIVMAPFVTAFVAYHQFFHYKTFLLIHIIIGEIAIMAVPFTNIGHMPFFIFSRFFTGSEYNWKPGDRRWK